LRLMRIASLRPSYALQQRKSSSRIDVVEMEIAVAGNP
jgi:hypothetical protein